MAKTPTLTVTKTGLIPAPPARVLAAFFDRKDLARWWQVVRCVAVTRPLGMYAIQWEPTDFKDEILGYLGGTFHGTIIDYDATGTVFIADAYWQPPDGQPIGPMAVDVKCFPHGDGGSTTLTICQSGMGDGARWERYFAVMDRGWASAIEELQAYLYREAQWAKK